MDSATYFGAALIFQVDQRRTPSTRSKDDLVAQILRTVHRLDTHASRPVGGK